MKPNTNIIVGITLITMAIICIAADHGIEDRMQLAFWNLLWVTGGILQGLVWTIVGCVRKFDPIISQSNK